MNWIKQGLIFVPTGNSDWMKSHAQIPLVDPVDDETLRIYFSTRDEFGRSQPAYLEVTADDPRNVTRVHSERVLELGERGAFDESGIMPFCIVNHENTKFLYYVGWSRCHDVPYHQAIGLAVSNDGGESYSRFSDGPICDRSVEEPFFNTAPYVLRHNGVWKMWYVSCTGWELVSGYPEPSYLVKYAESADGIQWNKTGIVCIGYDGQTRAIARPFVSVEDDRFQMFYSFRDVKDYRTDPTRSYRLGYAESEDGISWVRKDDQVGISRSSQGWDSEMLAYSSLYQHKEKKYLFYNGNGFGKSGFGYAVLDRSTND